MRCCVLSVMTEILLNQLSHEGLDDNAKEQRDLYLELLEEHTMDSNAFVRSRVLQLWQKIVQNNAVPKIRFLMVVDLAIERILDRSSNVCKHAISLLKVILEHNPYGAQLNIQQLANQLLLAEEQMQTLERKIGSFKNMSRENIWESLQPDIIIFLSSIINFSEEEEEASQLTQLLTKDTLQENIKTVAVFLTNRKFEQAYNMIRTIERAFPAAKTIKSDMPPSNTLNYYLTIMKEMFMMYAPSEEECQPEVDGNKPEEEEAVDEDVSKEQEELKMQKVLVTFLMDCLEFSKKVEDAVLNVILILNEESIAEVLEAINFLSTTYQFGVPKAEKGVQEMLSLVFRKEPAVKEAVTAAYSTLYLTVDLPSKREKAIEKVNRLSKLASSLDFGQLEALTSLIVGWLKSKELDDEFINVLLDRVKAQNIEIYKKQTALVLLGMVTQEHPELVKTHLPLLINRGLRVDCSDPNNVVILTCKIISNISLCKATPDEKRYPPDHEMFTLLIGNIRESFTKLEGSEIFIQMAEEAVNVIMEFCSVPNEICGELLCDLFEMMRLDPSLEADQINDNTILNINESCTASNDTISNPNTNPIQGEDVVKDKNLSKRMNVKTDTFLRFLFLVGHVAFKYSQFLEGYYLETLKQKLRTKFKTLSPSRDSNKIKEITRRSIKSKQAKGEEETVTESDLLAAADDMATEQVRHMLDSDVVCGNGVLAGFSLLIIDVCKNPKKYQNPLITCVAATALAETMMVSSVFCNENMQLLVTMLEKCSEENVRLSLVIVFGDLLFKFPNTVEPWTRFLYARLRDESWKVRRNTLLVLSHLVTNEMVKVKGQISEVALCIVDENEEIVDLAKRFFSELSLKGNTLYNVLPDIISHLSNPASDVTVEEKNFEIILKYIMDQIQKEKQLENLVEKLCKRMKESICERQWKDLAFCLSLLPWSDRSLRRLIDHAYCFCDRLLYQPVATLFLNIVATVTRSNKPGLKEIGAELNTIIDEVITKGSADHLQDPDDTVSELPSLPTKTPAKNPRKTPRKTPAKTPGNKRTGKKNKKVKYSSESEDDNADLDNSEDEEEKEIFKAVPKTTRSGRSVARLF
ncbi:meiotic chromosome condensation [Homalodisca vitripennis]|nr:meiotic chromosome condensation [Homalodisca vitripennis]